MTKKALINIFNTDGIIDFVKGLSEQAEYNVVATDICYNYLIENGIQAEKFDGNNSVFDIYIINFESFKKFQNKEMATESVLQQVDNIGFSLLENAVKNFKQNIIITSPSQYKEVLYQIVSGDIDFDIKEKLLQEAIMLVCKIHSELLSVLSKNNEYIAIAEKKTIPLSQGENPYQNAGLYSGNNIDYDVFSNEALTFNNILDVNLATAIASEFYDVNCAVITRHGLLCAAALGSDLENAFNKAIDCDPLSVSGAVVAFTQKISESFAQMLISMRVKIVIAPNFDEKSLELFQMNNIKVIKINTPLKDYKKYLGKEILITPFGLISQDANSIELEKNSFNLLTKKKPTTEMVEDMVFGWKVAKYTRSKSAVVVKDLRTTGISQGQNNIVEAVDIALNKACENSKDAVLIVDSAINTVDVINDAVQGRISGIIYPGSKMKVKEITSAADKYDLVMIKTGITQFRNK